MKKYSKLLLTLILVGGLVGCARATQVSIPTPTVQQVPGAASLVEKISMADRSTFGNATFEYMSDNLSYKYHKIPVGDFLLGHLVAAMPKDASITSIQLQKFSAKCDADGIFQPQSACDISLRVTLETGGSKNLIAVHVKESPGPWVSSFGSNFAKMTTDGEGDKILLQVRLMLRSLADKFVEQYKARQSA